MAFNIDTEDYESECLEPEPQDFAIILWMPSEGDGSPYQYGKSIINPTEKDKAEAARRWAVYELETTPYERWLCRKNSK